MLNLRSLIAAALILICVGNIQAQMPTPSEHHMILKKEEGKWKAKCRVFMGPAGPMPQPIESDAMEINTMIGGFWVVSSFEGNFGGLPFKGQGTFGYDEKQQKHVGTWIDSFSPNATTMLGTFDQETDTLTYITTGIGPDGQKTKGKNVTVFQGADKKKMTMYMSLPGQDEMMKAMEIEYERVKE